MRQRLVLHAALIAVALSLVAVLCQAAEATDDLPSGVMRGPLLHEHSFQAPLVNDWWEEGIPHFMIGGSTVANEKFLRLTTNNLDDSGFAFNTAPMDHDNWEAKVKLSVRPPPPALQAHSDPAVKYQGGDGLALWYLAQAIGDDHQHVLKYSKPISAEVAAEMDDMENPWRLMDVLLNGDATDDDIYDGIPPEDLTEAERKAHEAAKERKEQKRKKREELFRRIFKRGTSVDDTDFEPRIMGVKYSDFGSGFAIVLDSVGDEVDHLDERKNTNDAVEHHHHKPTISLLLNLPNHTQDSGASVVNNFDHGTSNFRRLKKVLQCEYDFRQKASVAYDARTTTEDDEEAKALNAPEEPIELVVRYYKRKLSILIRREDVTKRTVLRASINQAAQQQQQQQLITQVELQRTYRETLCGEVFPLTIPAKYHFGLSATTGRRKRKERKQDEDIFQRRRSSTVMHVDVHDVYQFELRELGTDPKSMGYSKSIPIEHFDYEREKREREHFSRQIPVHPSEDQ